jgi:hypothetical protein
VRQTRQGEEDEGRGDDKAERDEHATFDGRRESLFESTL